ncbi:MAG: DUF4136 domain-containing protein [Bacteroidetes bacterium]|nr:DUF4136 domain-containing protein [Bacteroidota bacterium]
MKTKLIIFVVMGMLAITSCTKYPPSSSRTMEDLVIYTKYDVTVQFTDYQTFAIVPAVSYIDGKDSATLTTPNAIALLDRISADMESRGFKKVNSTDNPDLGINVTAIKNTTTTVYYPGWYWGYPGYYPPNWWGYPGYGYGYPYYPTYTTSYSAGTVIIDLADFKFKTSDDKIMIRWNAYIRGLLTDTHSQGDVLNSVDQAFAQTPSLRTNP